MNKECIECGEPNNRPNSITCSPKCYQRRKTRTVAKTCVICNKEFFGRGKTCSREHALELKKRTNREKFGSDWAIQTSEAKKKRVETNLDKYGTEHPLQTEASLAKLRETSRQKYGTDYPNQNEEVKNKITKTVKEKYGVDNPFQSEEIKEKIKATNLERYGFEHAFQNEKVKEKHRLTMLERFGVENGFQSEEIKLKISESLLESLGVDHPSKSDEVWKKYRETSLANHGVPHPMLCDAIRKKMSIAREKSVLSGKSFRTVSQFNRDVARRITTRYGNEVVFEKAVEDRSFDLHIVDTNILIELNPLITHNSDVAYPCVLRKCALPCSEHSPTTRDAHFRRASLARKNGFKLIQIYEWDSIDDLFSLLDGKLMPIEDKFSARKLTVSEIPVNVANDFLEMNHIQGKVRGQKWIYGLFNDDDLLSVASFGESRFNNSVASHEWLRYSVKKNVIIHGGANKLFKFFVDKVNPDNVVSYVDFDHTTAENIFLNQCDFIELKETGPTLVWFNGKSKKKITNTSLLRLGADKLLGTNYGSREESGLNNEDILRLEGFLRVFTSGNRVFHWSNT